MALALYDDIAKRLVALLNANPGTWSASVSGNVGAFPSDDEIEAAIFEADSNIAVYGYFQSVNDSLANPFFTVSSDLEYGDDYPQHHGKINKVELSNDSTTWIVGVKTDSLDDITTAKAVCEAYVGDGAYDFIYCLDNGQFYSTMTYGRITYPAYERGATLKCNQNESSLLVFEAARLLTKNASPALFDVYSKFAEAGIQQIVVDGSYTPTPIP